MKSILPRVPRIDPPRVGMRTRETGIQAGSAGCYGHGFARTWWHGPPARDSWAGSPGHLARGQLSNDDPSRLLVVPPPKNIDQSSQWVAPSNSFGGEGLRRHIHLQTSLKVPPGSILCSRANRPRSRSKARKDGGSAPGPRRKVLAFQAGIGAR